ncbi:MAG: DUF917 domain-containing protein [Proteobacteria bacterium]|nr:MAG: DUF917 domain-containing protein [Pseudomonadota bacterium]
MKLQVKDLINFSRGAALLGTGGGGDPYIGRLMLEQALLKTGKLNIINLGEVADDALVVSVAMMGTPTVLVEKFPNGSEAENCLRAMEDELGRSIDAIIPAEIGGFNSAIPLVLSAQTGIPVINADGMGRAFPELQMVTYSAYGGAISPCVMTNERGDVVTIKSTNNRTTEMLARSVVMQMGGSAQICCYPMEGRFIKKYAIAGTLDIALGIGSAISQGRASGDPFEELISYLASTEHYRHSKLLFDGKIVDLVRKTSGGFTTGTASLSELGASEVSFEIVFQNENLAVRSGGRTLAIVPDLICILDRETAEPITTEALAYGQRVKVMAVSAPALLRSDAGLQAFGPKAFGIDEPFRPFESRE